MNFDFYFLNDAQRHFPGNRSVSKANHGCLLGWAPLEPWGGVLHHAGFRGARLTRVKKTKTMGDIRLCDSEKRISRAVLRFTGRSGLQIYMP